MRQEEGRIPRSKLIAGWALDGLRGRLAEGRHEGHRLKRQRALSLTEGRRPGNSSGLGSFGCSVEGSVPGFQVCVVAVSERRPLNKITPVVIVFPRPFGDQARTFFSQQRLLPWGGGPDGGLFC